MDARVKPAHDIQEFWTRASRRWARVKCGRSYITPPMPTTPDAGLSAKAFTIAWALATSSGASVNTSLMIATCAGWIAILEVKPSRRASRASARQLHLQDGD